MKYTKAIYLFVLHFVVLLCFKLSAQQATGNVVDEKAMKLLDKAIGDVMSSENFAFYFEGISLGLKTPEDIFTLPVYKVYKGGYVYMDKEKYEMQFGVMKSLCDGKLMVVVEEQSKTMFVDSVRKDTVKDPLNTRQFDEFMKDYFTEGTLKYEGVVTINKHKCHKIRSDIKNNKGGTHVIYWVDVNTNNLYLMAEYQNNAYCVYWINKVTKAPAKNKYTIYLPAKTLKDFHGYTVIDNRFIGSRH